MVAEETRLSSECLMDIIGVQTEIVQMGTDLGAVMATIAGHARRLTGAKGAVVELAEGDEMVYHAVSGVTDSQLGLRLSRRGSMSGLCVELGQPLVCRDSEADERVDREACRQVGLRSMIVVPLKHGGDIVGVLKVLSEKRDGFNSSAILILEMMSELIAASMFHAIRYEANELFYRATHDGLTGLANRSLFYDRLRQRIEHARRHEVSFGLLIMDIDGLKGINDQMGHRAGDALIKEFARRLKKASRKSDTAARLGGDEFGILLFQVAGIDEAILAGRRIEFFLQEPFRFEQCQLKLEASIGAAVYPADGADVESIFEKADREMYIEKRRRKKKSGK